ncbi:GDP-L-colitose synthase [compost metagenome]
MLEERGAEEVFVWGSGRQCRDFIHISDCIDFVWRTFTRLQNGGCLNISTGVATSFIELARLVSRGIGWEPKIRGRSDKPEGVFYRCGDTALQASYGLSPRVDLEAGVALTLDHLRSRVH